MTPATQPNPPPATTPVWIAKDMFGGKDYVVAPGARRGPRTSGPSRKLTREEYDQMMRRKWLSAWDTAAVIGCSDEHVYHLIEQGELVATNIAMPGTGRGSYRIDTAHIQKFLDRRIVG